MMPSSMFEEMQFTIFSFFEKYTFFLSSLPTNSNSLAPGYDVICRTGQFHTIGHLGSLIFRKGFFVLLLPAPRGLRDLSSPPKKLKLRPHGESAAS